MPMDIPPPLASLATRPLFAMQLEVASVQKIGGAGFAQVGVITGGAFEGDRLSGRILDGGSDWQSARPDGTVLIDCRLILETTGGARIAMTYRGVRTGPPEVLARLANGEPVDPADYYFRINPLFETADPALDWLNRIVAIGVGHRLPGGPIYNLFEIV